MLQRVTAQVIMDMEDTMEILALVKVIAFHLQIISPDYFHGHQDYLGYPNSGISHGQGYAAYPQNIYQNGGGYSPVNTPTSYHNTVGHATPSGPYPEEFV